MAEAKIFYFALTDEMRKEEKLDWFSENKINNIPFEHIIPDENNNWIDLTENDWDSLIPLANKETKLLKNQNEENSIFKLYSTGVLSSRDEWAYDLKLENLIDKVKIFSDYYNDDIMNWINSDKSKKDLEKIAGLSKISWSDSIRNNIKQSKKFMIEISNVRNSLYRPFVSKKIYFDNILCNTLSLQLSYFPDDNVLNRTIWVTLHQQVQFTCGASDKITDHGIGSRISQFFPLYIYTEAGERIEKLQIGDWSSSGRNIV
ncbi:MAG: hypothetical protein HW421_4017 [Ignavibacteria bacterium]|nr:hypothetical protein [Ignavibacteria bacterium]